MTLDTLIMLGGAIIVVLPFLGFPNSWDNVVFFIVGIFLVALGIIVRRRLGQSTGSGHQRGGTTYRESLPQGSDISSTLTAHGTKETVE